MSEDSGSSNWGCFLSIVCIIATTALLAIKYSVAPTIPFWVCLLPMIPVALQVTFGLLFIFGALCLFAFAIFITVAGSVYDWVKPKPKFKKMEKKNLWP